MTWVKMHMIAEDKDEEGWSSIHSWVWGGPKLYPKRMLYPSRVDTEVMPLFSVISGEWRDALPPERECLNGIRDIPEDLTTKSRSYLAQYEPIHKLILSPDEIKKYPWEKPLSRNIRVSRDSYKHWKNTGIVPKRAYEEPDDTKTEEITYEVNPRNMWGEHWFNFSLPRINSMSDITHRIICFFTEENHA